MKSYNDFINESRTPSKKRTAVFTFGRMNPPTSGHQKLVQAVMDTAKKHSADHFIFTSNTHDKKKNPLPRKVKVRYLRKMVPKANVVLDKYINNIWDILDTLQDKGKYEHVIMVVGSDRVNEFKTLISRYISSYSFTFEVVSAGTRDPDSQDITESMSASKMRELAAEGTQESRQLFIKSCPLSPQDAERLYNIVRKGMGLSVPSTSSGLEEEKETPFRATIACDERDLHEALDQPYPWKWVADSHNKSAVFTTEAGRKIQVYFELDIELNGVPLWEVSFREEGKGFNTLSGQKDAFRTFSTVQEIISDWLLIQRGKKIYLNYSGEGKRGNLYAKLIKKHKLNRSITNLYNVYLIWDFEEGLTRTLYASKNISPTHVKAWLLDHLGEDAEIERIY